MSNLYINLITLNTRTCHDLGGDWVVMPECYGEPLQILTKEQFKNEWEKFNALKIYKN